MKNSCVLCDGGALGIRGVDYVQLANSTFQGNLITEFGYQGGYGGAVYLLNNHFHARVESCSFTENTARVCGGAVAGDGAGLVTFRNSTFDDNSASRDGGAVYLPG